eukprot:436806-Amphidinium_carterae.4
MAGVCGPGPRRRSAMADSTSAAASVVRCVLKACNQRCRAVAGDPPCLQSCMGAPSRVLPIFAPDCQRQALAERTYWTTTQSVVSGGVSTKVTRFGACAGVCIGSASDEGESASGAAQAGRRERVAQDLGSISLGTGTGLLKGTRALLGGGCAISSAAVGGNAGPAWETLGPGVVGRGGNGSPVPHWTIATLVASRRMRSSGDRSRPCSATHHASACAGVAPLPRPRRRVIRENEMTLPSIGTAVT